MASKEKPTRRGKKNEGDPLAELEQVLNGAAKGPENRTSLPVEPLIDPDTKKHETEVQQEIEKKVDERIAAETGESKALPPELLAHLPEKERTRVSKMFEGLKDPRTKESVIARLTADEAKKKMREEKEAQKIATTSKTLPESKPDEQKKPKPRIKGKPAEMRDAVEFEPPTTAETEADGRIEPTLGAELGQPEDLSSIPDGTTDWRERWQGKLRRVIEGAKEKFDWYKSSEEGLIRRNKELDAQLEKVGGVEKGFRWIGEKYNKLSWKTKLAVGVALGLGAVATAGTLAVAFPLFGIAAQRAAGLATMYLKFEKNSHQEKWGKEKAMLKAGVYTALIGIAIKEAIEYASGTELAHAAQAKVEGWLGTMLGYNAPAAISGSTEAVSSSVPEPAPEAVPSADITPPSEVLVPPQEAAPEVPATAAAAGEVAGTAAVAPEIPSISVEASAGHGYEYMAKRLWEQLQSQNLDASKFDANSDIHKLLTADAATIDKVVHQIAADPQHGFFNPDGTNVRIDMGSHMAIGADGQIHLNEMINAPEGARITSAYHPEMPIIQPTAEVPPIQGFDVEQASEAVATTPIGASAPVEMPTTSPIEASTPSLEKVDMDVVAPDQTIPTVEAPEHSLETAPLTSEATPTNIIEQANVIPNQFGLTVPAEVSHIYADPGAAHMLVYGGSPAEQAKSILKYLTENPDKVVFGTDDSGNYRIPWHLVEGKIIPGAPMRTSGFFGFFSSFMEAPKPDELEKLIQ